MRGHRDILISLSLADHLGDVNYELPHLAKLFGEEPPVWCDECERYVFPWEDSFNSAYGHEEDYEYHEEE